MTNRIPFQSLCGILFVSALYLVLAEPSQAIEPSVAQWTRFRGPNGVGRVEECNVPLPWTADQVAWEIGLPGKGNGSPIVMNGQVFLLAAHPESAERYALSYDLKTGQELWRKAFASQPHHLHTRSSYGSCTPCADERAVYFTWGSPEEVTLIAFSHSGEELWKKSLGPYVSQHGYGASPALYGSRLILVNSQDSENLPPGVKPGASSVKAFDPATGEQLWETPRETVNACYGVPALFTTEQGEEALLFCNTGDGLYALRLEDGKPLWNNQVFVKRCVSCPIIVGDVVIGTEGSGGGGNILYAINLQGNHSVQFKVDRSAPYVPTPVAKDDLLFLWGDTGIVTCVRTPSGEILWSKRIGGNVSTSPVIAGDKLVGIAEDGTVTILAAAETFQELGSVRLEETSRATPLLGNNYMLIRTDSKLICVGTP
jgi:outer membrane protein assembly factor BamB